MSLSEIKDAVRDLSPKELAELAAFIAKQDNAAWDKEMKEGSATGKLDFLFEEAERERAAGQLRDWTEKVRSKCTRRFWKLQDALPLHVKKMAGKSYDLWRPDHSQPSLDFTEAQRFKRRSGRSLQDRSRAATELEVLGANRAARCSGGIAAGI